MRQLNKKESKDKITWIFQATAERDCWFLSSAIPQCPASFFTIVVQVINGLDDSLPIQRERI